MAPNSTDEFLLITQMRTHMKGLTGEGRLNFIAEVMRGYCKHCGDPLMRIKDPGQNLWRYGPCHCTNEE